MDYLDRIMLSLGADSGLPRKRRRCFCRVVEKASQVGAWSDGLFRPDYAFARPSFSFDWRLQSASIFSLYAAIRAQSQSSFEAHKISEVSQWRVHFPAITPISSP